MSTNETIRGNEPATAPELDEVAHAARIAMLGELMASITHEINQPLAAVVTDGNAALRWLNRPEPNAEEASAALRRMIAEAMRASQIVARTRQLASKGRGERTSLDVGVLVHETIAITRSQLSRLGAQVRLALDPRLPPILADRVQIQQVLINLLVNAAQAMATGAAPERHIALSAVRDAESVVFDVADSGPGVSADDEAKVFNAFYSTKPEGMGLGLSVAKTIVETHGGRISLLPDQGRGATFRVALPVAVA